MSTLSAYLQSRNFTEFEGYSQQVPGQTKDLAQLISHPDVRTVMEIGFNAGHSAEIFLKTNPNITLVSFDLGCHDYVKVGKEYIDSKYPGRHTLILGDSTKTIPKYIEENPGKTFDLLFIDGCHEYDFALADMSNCRLLAHKNSIVLLDDTMFTNGWVAHFNVGPTKVWLEFIRDNKLLSFQQRDYRPGRGMSWGQYIL